VSENPFGAAFGVHYGALVTKSKEKDVTDALKKNLENVDKVLDDLYYKMKKEICLEKVAAGHLS